MAVFFLTLILLGFIFGAAGSFLEEGKRDERDNSDAGED